MPLVVTATCSTAHLLALMAQLPWKLTCARQTHTLTGSQTHTTVKPCLALPPGLADAPPLRCAPHTLSERGSPLVGVWLWRLPAESQSPASPHTKSQL